MHSPTTLLWPSLTSRCCMKPPATTCSRACFSCTRRARSSFAAWCRETASPRLRRPRGLTPSCQSSQSETWRRGSSTMAAISAIPSDRSRPGGGRRSAFSGSAPRRKNVKQESQHLLPATHVRVGRAPLQRADDIPREHHLGGAEDHVSRQLGINVVVHLSGLARVANHLLDGVERHQHRPDVV